jgi:phosphoenolpyruvate synthase/pyruvate phosphate dikinase
MGAQGVFARPMLGLARDGTTSPSIPHVSWPQFVRPHSAKDIGLIVWLADDRAIDPSVVGNKAARIAALRRRGYPVPDGFCVPLDAWSNPDWRDAVRAAARVMSGPWVARSSTTAEDGARYAFPGLFKTVLGIADADALVAAIDAVRASGRAKAVGAYAARLGAAAPTIRLSVLVQPLVPAAAAGVAYSRHPITGARETHIEANYGLGETVVNGSIAPDSYVERDGTVVARVGSKLEKLIADSASTVRRVPTSAAERDSLVLADRQVLEIASLVRRAEHDVGVPVDVEWAFDADQLVLLQARPITGHHAGDHREPSR